MDKLKLLAQLLSELRFMNHDLISLSYVIEDMAEAGDGDTSFSVEGLGINITKDTIDFVDIELGKSIATLKLEINENY